MTSTARPWRWHMSIQRCENVPLQAARTLSPFESVFEIAVSQPPVPVEGNIKTLADLDFRTVRTPSRHGCRMPPNRDERWSMVGIVQACWIASGMFVGPGMKTGFWKLMSRSCLVDVTLISAPNRGNFFGKAGVGNGSIKKVNVVSGLYFSHNEIDFRLKEI